MRSNFYFHKFALFVVSIGTVACDFLAVPEIDRFLQMIWSKTYKSFCIVFGSKGMWVDVSQYV